VVSGSEQQARDPFWRLVAAIFRGDTATASRVSEAMPVRTALFGGLLVTLLVLPLVWLRKQDASLSRLAVIGAMLWVIMSVCLYFAARASTREDTQR
jgi:hypothetical protein